VNNVQRIKYIIDKTRSTHKKKEKDREKQYFFYLDLILFSLLYEQLHMHSLIFGIRLQQVVVDIEIELLRVVVHRIYDQLLLCDDVQNYFVVFQEV